ncbi:MAG: M20/M25/M40 family metallo-hydrolase, partial [Maritimibacter sp.]|nr:M20/M25/M40 family metallo-hydrolase [Maritimibacter sp.]
GAALTDFAQATAAARGLTLDMTRSYRQAATPCDPALSDRLAKAVETVTGAPAPRLASGATHDASAMADLCPVAMLFTRCAGGVSHRPEEAASGADMARAVAALVAFLTAPGWSAPR